MRSRTLNIGTVIPESEALGVEFYGDPNAWKLISKASCDEEGWMKSTRAMEIPGLGCLVQVSTHQIGRDGTHSITEAIVAIPGVGIDIAGRLVKDDKEPATTDAIVEKTDFKPLALWYPPVDLSAPKDFKTKPKVVKKATAKKASKAKPKAKPKAKAKPSKS